MSALAFTWRGLVRQPARAALGIFGIAAVGALLFDMLLLSRGLVLSLEQMLDDTGFEIRVAATPPVLGGGPTIGGAAAIAVRLAALEEVDEAIPLRFADAEVRRPNGWLAQLSIFGADASKRRIWTVLRGRDIAAEPARASGEVLVNENLAGTLGLTPGDAITIEPSCRMGGRSALPRVTFRVAGVARFPFETVTQMSAATSRLDLERACGKSASDDADLILVATAAGVEPDAARDAIMRVEPTLVALTNTEVVGRMEQSNFSYFRQISTVLATVTMAFGLLLITVLLTVSVNQRLGTIAALRAIGFSARRVMADVVLESALLVGIGGTLAVPLGFALAEWLDVILKRMPGIPADTHFFVFEPRVIVIHVVVLVATAVLATLYPIRLVARLPIATTLRNEVIS